LGERGREGDVGEREGEGGMEREKRERDGGEGMRRRRGGWCMEVARRKATAWGDVGAVRGMVDGGGGVGEGWERRRKGR